MNTTNEPAGIDLDKPDTLAALLCCLYEGPEIQRAATMLIDQAMQIEELTLARRAPAPVVDERSLPPKPHTTYNGYSDGSEPLWTAAQMEDYARAALAQQSAAPVVAHDAPDGWKCVPLEPTERMREAAASFGHPDAHGSHPKGYSAQRGEEAVESYRHMIAAAPEAPASAQPDRGAAQAMTCPQCGVDRLKEPCPGMADECAMIGDAHLLAPSPASQPVAPEATQGDDKERLHAIKEMCFWVSLIQEGKRIGTLHHGNLTRTMNNVMTAFNLPQEGDDAK